VSNRTSEASARLNTLGVVHEPLTDWSEAETSVREHRSARLNRCRHSIAQRMISTTRIRCKEKNRKKLNDRREFRIGARKTLPKRSLLDGRRRCSDQALFLFRPTRDVSIADKPQFGGSDRLSAGFGPAGLALWVPSFSSKVRRESGREARPADGTSRQDAVRRATVQEEQCRGWSDWCSLLP
jgi:hypothetical protein